jgi:hypothetical protein
VSTPAFINAKYTARAGDLAIPVVLCLNFEAPLTEWNLFVHGDDATGVVDIFRDIYVRLPNDGLHKTGTVFRTSVLATWQHWAQHFTSGIRHLTGRLRYGNEGIFTRFAEAVVTGTQPRNIGPEDALRVLHMQHEIMAAVSDDGGA